MSEREQGFWERLRKIIERRASQDHVPHGSPLYHRVSIDTGISYTEATELCRRLGLDPEARIGVEFRRQQQTKTQETESC